jgi:hypothetical protein
MRTMRAGVAWLAGTLAACMAAPHLTAQQPDPYGTTIHFGTGLINTPVAWVSARSGDLWVSTSGKNLPSWPDPDEQNFATRWNTNISAETHWWGRVSLGASAYSQNPEYGFFGRALLLRDNQFGFLPALAAGFRNLGPYDKEDRFLIAHDVCLDSLSGKYEKCHDPRYENFKTAPTLYVVATKEIPLSNMFGRLPGSWMSLSLGWGNGLFSEDGDLGDSYNKSGTLADGLFLGTRVSTHPSLNTTLSFIVENDGWDWNAGVVGDWRGLSLGIYGTELEEGGREDNDVSGFYVYNYRKLNVTLGYTGNVVDISRGILLRTRITELTREQLRLRTEISQRERRIRGLEVALRRAQAGELADIERRRQELEREVQAEREAIRRAEERLRQIQEGQRPTPTPPSTTPPSL